MEILDQHKSKFGVNFTDNKKTLDQVSVIRSKGLKNEIAGFITKCIKHEIHDQKLKEERIERDAQAKESEESEPVEVTEEKTETQTTDTKVPSEESS